MRRLLITLFAISGFLQLLNAQAGVGAKYGARDPAKCRSTKEPDKGAPTPEQVKRYVMCALEGEQGVAPPNLTLLENVQVERRQVQVGCRRELPGVSDSWQL